MVNGLLQKLVDARQEPEAPSMGQLVLVHWIYLMSFLVVGATALLGTLRYPRMAAAVAATLLFFLLLTWAALARVCTARNPPVGVWYASHLAWLTRTFWGVLVMGGICAAALVVAFFVGLLVPPVLLLIYTPILLGPPTGLWLIYRLIRGYMGLLGHRRVGYIPPPSY